jgi:hypothetical protein
MKMQMVLPKIANGIQVGVQKADSYYEDADSPSEDSEWDPSWSTKADSYYEEGE